MQMAAPAGRVITHERKILRITFRSSAPIPRARPTPNTPPTNVCVVDIGRPLADATTTVQAVASSAANPREGVSSVMFFQMVAITR